MSQIPATVRQYLIKLIPSSILNEITCFVFYDHHPKDPRNVDVTICTKSREIKEFYQRKEVKSTLLSTLYKSSHIRIMRNSKCELFYLVANEDSITILTSKQELQIIQNFSNVDRFEVQDAECWGQATLKIILKDDAIPLVFDDNFNIVEDTSSLSRNVEVYENLPLITNMMRKITEVQYYAKCNDKAHKDFLSLRHKVTYSSYLEAKPNLGGSAFNDGYKEMIGELRLESLTPWVKMCNQNIVIVLKVVNDNTVQIEDLEVLLHSSSRSSLVYTTKLFEHTTTFPFWKKKPTQILEPEAECAVVVVTDLKELQYDVMSRVEFKGFISFKKQEKEHSYPFDNVVLSACDTMREQFDVLYGELYDHKVLLAILATAEGTDLILRHIKTDNNPNIVMIDEFCTHLQLEKIPLINLGLIYKSSPFHVLNGLMIVFQEDESNRVKSHITVYTRSPSQVLGLIHYIHDAIPHRIVITTHSHRITSKTPELFNFNEYIPSSNESYYLEYASSIVTQSAMLLKYLDKCIIKMNHSKDPILQNKVGSEIDLFASGVETYMQFRASMLDEALKGMESEHNFCDYDLVLFDKDN